MTTAPPNEVAQRLPRGRHGMSRAEVVEAQRRRILLAGMEEQFATDGDPIERLEGALRAYLETIAANPMFARLFLVESVAAGPQAIERRAAVQRRIVESLWRSLELRSAQDRFACELVVAGVGARGVPLLVSGDVDSIRRLRRPVLQHVRRLLR